MSAMNSATSCMVVVAISCQGCTPGIQLDNRLSSFRSQHIGKDTDEGSVLAYGPNENGVSASGCTSGIWKNALESLSSIRIFSKSAFASAVLTGGLAFGENR